MIKNISTTKKAIFVILLLLIILYICYPYFLINIAGLVNSTKNKEPLDVVIAHYKEDLSWVDTDLPSNCRIFIYTKSDQKPNCKRKYIHEYLPNVGRDMNTHLHHIIKYYDKPMNENIIFLPGSCDLLYKKINLYLLIHNIGKYDFNNCTLTNSYFFKKIFDFTLDNYYIKYGYCSTNKNNRHKNCRLIKYKFENYDEFKKYFGLQVDYYSYWNMNLIKSKLIHKREKEYYIQLYNVVNNADNVLNGHFIEKSWYSIFRLNEL